ncbi:MAG: two-component regulator propeller domain-containing protein [Ignavibacteriaceae bacterium]|nr:two-component regulator propeller domain-containing protein [Ignavibacteriaceae bacterium]
MNGGWTTQFDRSNETFTHYWHNPSDHMSLSDNWVTALLEDRSGTLWITADNGDVIKFDKVSGNFTH